MQRRTMTVGKPGALVEMPARERAQPVEMRLDMAEQRIWEVDAQEVGQRRRSSCPWCRARAARADSLRPPYPA